MKLDLANDTRSISRRDALKVLTALGGAAALSTVPNNWEKPLVQVGSLPAFAQLTQTVVLDSIDPAAVGTGVGGSFDLNVCVDYHDAVGGVCSMKVELFWPEGTSPVTDSFTEHYAVGQHPDESGSFCQDFLGLTQRAATVQVCVTLYDCTHGFSNTVCRTITIGIS